MMSMRLVPQVPKGAPMTHPLSVAVAGLGTVGGGVLKLLRDNADVVAARAGRPIAVTRCRRATARATAACRCRACAGTRTRWRSPPTRRSRSWWS